MYKDFDQNYLEFLGHKLKDGSLTDKERELLDEWYNQHDDGMLRLPFGADPELIKNSMLMKIHQHITGQFDRVSSRGLKFVRILKLSMAIVFISGSFFLYRSYSDVKIPRSPGSKLLAENESRGNNAILTLSDGRKIQLKDVKNGALLDENGITISKTKEGQLRYAVDKGSKVGGNKFNTIETPRGGSYQIVLQDGTTVWLNAASVLTFPSSFDNCAIREVNLQGEGYFEVAKNKSIPFVVKTNTQQVVVLGTHFNVNCYDEDPDVKITLLKGSIKVKADSQPGFKVLKPGQQSVFFGGKLSVIDVDTEPETAWRQGEFVFTGQSLKVIMRMISRWYDIDVKYDFEPSKDLEFEGQVSRSRSLAEVLKMLEETGEIKFTRRGKEVIISK